MTRNAGMTESIFGPSDTSLSFIAIAFTFSTAEAEQLTGMSQRQVRFLAAQGVVGPSDKAPDGKGTLASYTMEDLLALELVKALREVCGAKYGHERLADAVDTARKANFTGTLVCDGQGSWCTSSRAEETMEVAAVVVLLKKVSDAADMAARRSSLVVEVA